MWLAQPHRDPHAVKKIRGVLSKCGRVGRYWGGRGYPRPPSTTDWRLTVQFAILINETESSFAARTDPAKQDEYWGAFAAYGKALREAGVFVGGQALQPPEGGATVRIRGGERRVQDGPFADTKEQLGGFVLIDVPDLETALDWAARCPAAATGSVEVRLAHSKCES